MTLKNEIFEGIATYKALNNPQDKYAEEMYKARRRQNQQDDQLDRDAQNEIDEQNRRRATPAPAPVTMASTGMPGAAISTGVPPTIDQEIAGWSRYRRGGRVRRFADGGSVEDDASNPGGPVDPNDPDTIVRQLLAEDGTARDRINRTVGEPWTVTGATGDWHSEGVKERTAQERKTADAQAMDTSSFQGQPTVQPRSRLRRVADTVQEFVSPVGTEGKYRHGQAQREAIRQATPGILEPLSDAELAQRERTTQQLYRDRADEGTVALQVNAPSGVRKLAEDLVAAAKDKSGMVDESGMPVTTPTAAPTAASAAAVPGQSVVRAQGQKRNVPLATPAAPAAVATLPPYVVNQNAGVPVPGPVPTTPNGPPTPATPAQGSGNGTVQAPPPVSTAANAPSTAPKPAVTTTAPPAAAVARGSLGDQRRTEAFDPTGTTRPGDLTDPRNAGAVDVAGRDVRGTNLNTADIRQTVAGAMQAAPPGSNGAVGDNAVSRDTYRQFVATHDQGGKLTSGQAMLVGMVGRYKGLLRQGRMKEAQQMAWGLVQAANIEAASFAKVALDQMKAGDMRGMTQNLAKSADHVPDGMNHRASADGRSIETYDQSGKLVGRLPMNGQVALQLAMGLSDGSLMWQALQQTVESMKTPDKNAEGRALDNEYKRRQIENAILRNKKLAAGGGGKAAPAASEASSRVDARLGTTMPKVPVAATSQGSDDGALPDVSRVVEDQPAESD